MSPFANASIKNKLRLLLSMSIIFMLITAGSVLMVNSFLSNRTVLTNEVSALSEVTTLAIAPALLFDNKEDAQQTLETLKAHKDIVYAAVLKMGQQQAFAAYQREGNWRLPEDKLAAFEACQEAEFSLNFLSICKSLILEGVNYGEILLVISLHEIYQRLMIELGVAFLGLMFASGLIFMVMGRFAKKLSDPILELLTISEEVSQSGEYEQRATIQSTDEIGRLGLAFNSMLNKIQEWNNALTDQKENLEELVEKRTQDLLETKDKALMLADQAQKASKAKSEFLSVMSHEIRTPLNAIIGYSDLLKESHLDQQQSEYSNIINQSSNSLLGQINDILDFSKIEAGKMELDLVMFDVYELLNIVIASNRHASSSKSLMLDYHVDSDLPHYLYGDEQKIRQILHNLLNNAIKFTERGSVSLHVRVDDTVSESCVVVISIKDTGIGISEQKQAVLFDPFTQADASNTRKYGGTGLGLAIVKKMVTLLGGDISFQSIEGVGTEFSLRLPLKRTAPEFAKQPIAKPLIALFDDAPDSAIIVQLKQLDYNIEIIDSTKEQLLQEQPALAEKYAVLLFTQRSYEQALYWYELNLQSEQKIVTAFCLEDNGNSEEIKHLKRISLISVSDDNLHLVEQINRLMSAGLSDITFTEMADELKVMVVEDNPVNMLMAQTMLKQTGFKILTASNGQLAVDAYKANDIDLILMDCQMPIMDGFAASREIRVLEMDSGKRVPIIALTANAFKEDRQACLVAGMDDFLSKPFKKKQLLGVMEQWLTKDKQQKIVESEIKAPESELATENVLDETIIEELIEMDDPGSKQFITQVSTTFFTNAEQVFQKIEAAFSENSIEAVAQYAHQLKSSSGNVAAKRLSDLFKKLEAVANQGDFQEAEELWKPIGDEYRLVELAYDKILKD